MSKETIDLTIEDTVTILSASTDSKRNEQIRKWFKLFVDNI